MSRINTNVSAIQTVHKLVTNQLDLNTRLERLSTGLRINRGRDDPAGLIASETLRSEMRGISQAIDNSQRTINVISTAEGALNEVSSLLLDLRSLINHAANQGAIGGEELQADQLQIDSILEAIDRIANTTQFGGEKLINGNFEYSVSGMVASSIAAARIFGARVPPNSAAGVVVEVVQSALTAQVAFNGSAIGSSNVTIELSGRKGIEVLSFAAGTGASSIVKAINANSLTTGVSATISGTGSTTAILINSQDYGADAFVSVKPIDGTFIVGTGSTSQDSGRDAGVLINGQTASVSGLVASLRSNGLDLQLHLTADRGTTLGSSEFQITGGGAIFQIGPTVNANGQVSIGIPSVATSNLGNPVVGYLNTIKSAGSNAVIAGNYQRAEEILEESISQVAVLRGRLGGLQRNQIETNMNSQRVALENVTAAESSIRDADFAVETAALTRAQVLLQSTTSVLGIANSMPQYALSLLQ
ncbi:MAG: flagellin [Phycisphaerales bacterium]|nr:flagellin [Phycisphaerales bacterium]